MPNKFFVLHILPNGSFFLQKDCFSTICIRIHSTMPDLKKLIKESFLLKVKKN